MRTIGMLGGMSWQSTAKYYALANELVARRLGGLHSARCVVYSVDFAEIEALQSAGRWDTAGELLAGHARQVEAAGADVLLLCTNTMHKVYDAVRAAVGIPMVHLADATAAAVHAAGVDTVGLLGTRFTMEQDFYTDRLAGHGLTTLVPDADDRVEVDRIIYTELCLGKTTEESRRTYLEVVHRLLARGARGVVLGCTEIELLIGRADLPVPAFPTTELHVAAAVELALRDEVPAG